MQVDEAIDLLTHGEGDMVTFCCKNPDFNGLPNECVIVNADWTGWQDRAFRADTRAECLVLAVKALRVAAGVDLPAEGWKPSPALEAAKPPLGNGVRDRAIRALNLAIEDRQASDTVEMNVGDLSVMLGLLLAASPVPAQGETR